MEQYKKIDVGNLKSFKSCMKINGVPILPPLMTLDRTAEMAYYKQLAMAVEKRLAILKVASSSSIVNKSNRTVETDTGCSHYDFPENDTDKVRYYKMENPKIAVIDEYGTENGHTVITNVDSTKLNKQSIDSISSDVTVVENVTCDSTLVDCSSSYLYKLENRSYKNITGSNKGLNDESFSSDIDITRDLLDVTPTRVIRQESYTILTPSRVLISQCDSQPKTRLRCSVSAGHSEGIDVRRRALSSAPSLVRSNSYTLEEPGPQLKAHLESQGIYLSDNSLNMSSTESPTKSTNKRKGWDIEWGKAQWSGVDDSLVSSYNNVVEIKSAKQKYINFPKLKMKKKYIRCSSPLSSKSSPAKATVSVGNSYDSPTKLKPKTPAANKDNSKKCSGREPYSQKNNDDLLQCNNVNQSSSSESAHQSRRSTPNHSVKHDKSRTVNEDRDAEESIRQILDELQTQHAKQMADLLKRQQDDQNNLQLTFMQQQSMIVKQIQEVYPKLVLDESSAKEKLGPDERESCLGSVIPGNEVGLKIHTGPDQTSDVIILQTQTLLTDPQILLQEVNTSVKSYSKSRSIIISPTNIQPDSRRSSFDSERTVQISVSDSTESDVFYTSENTPVSLQKAASNSHKSSSGKAMNCVSDVYYKQYMNKISNDAYESEKLARSTLSLPTPSASPRVSVDYLSTPNLVSRQLFPINGRMKGMPFNEQQEYAATIICAAARGYLVRRVLRSRRVQALKQTIQDTLLGALQLHRDSSGQIQYKDIELHRTLIHQLNAACLALHDIFFYLSTVDRMRIISHDRDQLMGLRGHSQMTSPDQRCYRADSGLSGLSGFTTTSSRGYQSEQLPVRDKIRARSRNKSTDGISHSAGNNSYNKAIKQQQNNDFLHRSMSQSSARKPWR